MRDFAMAIRIAAVLAIATFQLLFIAAVFVPNWTWHVHNVLQGPSPVPSILMEAFSALVILAILVVQPVVILRGSARALPVVALGLVAIVVVGALEAVGMW